MVVTTGVASLGPRGAMAPSLSSYFSIVLMSWFTFTIVSILCCGPLTCFLLATPLVVTHGFLQASILIHLCQIGDIIIVWLLNISCSLCTQDIVSSVVCSLLFFAVSVPMEFYSGELTEINGIIEFLFEVSGNSNNNLDPSDIKMLFNLDQLIPASGAAAVCC